jgi:hypothetical protein
MLEREKIKNEMVEEMADWEEKSIVGNLLKKLDQRTSRFSQLFAYE